MKIFSILLELREFDQLVKCISLQIKFLAIVEGPFTQNRFCVSIIILLRGDGGLEFSKNPFFLDILIDFEEHTVKFL